MSTLTPPARIPEATTAISRIVTAGLAAALLFLGISSWRTLSELRTIASESETRDARDLVLLRAENDRLKGVAPQTVTPVAGTAVAGSKLDLGVQRVEALSFLSDLSKRGYFATPVPTMFLPSLVRRQNPNIKVAAQPAYMINAIGSFGPGFAEFFGLNAEEERAFQTGFTALKEEMERAIHANATLRREADGSIVIEVKPVEGAMSFRERFTALLQETLGAERYRAFTALNFSSLPPEPGPIPAMLTGNVNFFGEDEGTFTIMHTPTNYRIRSSLKGPAGNGGVSASGGIAMSSEELREMLIKSHGAVMKLLPADF